MGKEDGGDNSIAATSHEAMLTAEDEAQSGDVEAADDELVAEDVELCRALPTPILPSQTDIDHHWINHLPFRSWCGTCINGRGRERHHARTHGKRRIPTLNFDYCFISKDGVFSRK